MNAITWKIICALTVGVVSDNANDYYCQKGACLKTLDIWEKLPDGSYTRVKSPELRTAERGKFCVAIPSTACENECGEAPDLNTLK